MFKGQIDEIITKSSGEKITVKITARSMAGILLDNEAEPCIYFNASSSVILNGIYSRLALTVTSATTILISVI